MKKYAVYISYRENGYVEVEANNEEEAEEKAYQAIQNGDVTTENPYDEPDYEFEVEEIENEKQT